MKKLQSMTMTEIIEAHLRLTVQAFSGGTDADYEASMRGGLVVADLQTMGYGSIAEAAHKARRETLAEVQAHVRDELEQVQPGGREPSGPGRASTAEALAKVDSYLSNLLIEHATADPEGRALAEGILERKAAKG